MEQIKFVTTQEEQDRLDALLNEVNHKEIKTEPVMRKTEQEYDWIDAILDDPVYDERGMEVIERRNKLLYD